jgi:oligopeptide transport system ATP-binding protein
MTASLIEAENLTVHFPVTEGVLFSRQVGNVRAVDGVSFGIAGGETLGLVGESGCGKSTTGKALLRLQPPTAGRVMFGGADVLSLPSPELRQFRRRAQIIFQDPFSSLNPRMSVRDIIAEPLIVHGERAGLDAKVREMLDKVGLAAHHAERYPHQFSGGQRQRIGIARALALRPSFIVCDEAVSALDVSIQAQVINLLQDLQDEFKLTYLFISHDLGVVKHIADRIAVMYLGKIVELADGKAMFRNPQHPYTQALLASMPVRRPELRKPRRTVKGDVPSALNPPSGCRFHTRCPFARQACQTIEPVLRQVASDDSVACHMVAPAHPAYAANQPLNAEAPA